MKIRSFLAFDISDEMRGELSSLITFFSGKISGIKWMKPELLHGTLRFFGDVEENILFGDVSRVVEYELRHQSPLRLSGHGVGVFPNWRYPSIIWAGLQGDTEPMIGLYSRLEEAFRDFGFKEDKRAFRMHLTLGRAKGNFGGAKDFIRVLEKMSDAEFGETVVDSLTLYKSELTRNGPIYTVIRKFAFGPKR
ncbi:MAG TPA: RNA 2',3'-cyclic phosphodiesterase [bacterium]|nr:RNA 2',3'-cyclic phosphodiesterase [Myxococcales bacterium]OQA58701.1 MAG: 2',5' RNA ligase family [bacterium ADurb.Bin270]HPW45014.1 RNA 2',3'-cyclic phosphodiesterase [bacterium]